MAAEASKPIDSKVLWGGGRSPFSVSYGKLMMWFFLISDALTFGGFLGALGFARHKFEAVWPVTEQIFYHFPFVPHDVHLPLLYVALMTFILIVSSVTMVLAVEAGHRMDKKGVTKWLALTVVGGFIFLGSQAWEWSTFIHGSDHGVYKLNSGFTTELVTSGGEKTTADLGSGVVAEIQADESLLIKNGEFIGSTVTGEDAEAIKSTAEFVHGASLTRNEYGHQLYADFFFFITGFHGTHVLSGVILNLVILINVIKGVYHKRGHYEMVEKSGLYWHFVDLVWVFVFTFFYLV
ncbi:cytochrome c oxidase subunit 3 [Salibacter sp.]|uniref:cytochrome c oxidase subunit 3 n=1 Tax=Salibacter sp. TaxID=2010995 RepID=UPI00286FE41B|nr:cytochrome c oxidase subunit 3 [Salibacter sp.]MDR9397996.1 cytochrome c oxidase subunit 3 [Salibacter sp.]MDR9486862.1 cytochrome c oxidase subunit 3 [Salibacter sp.]